MKKNPLNKYTGTYILSSSLFLLMIFCIFLNNVSCSKLDIKTNFNSCGIQLCSHDNETNCIANSKYISVSTSSIYSNLFIGSSLLNLDGGYEPSIPDPTSVKAGLKYKGYNNVSLIGAMDKPDPENVLSTAALGDSFGLLADKGTWDLSSDVFNGEGYYSDIVNVPLSSQICVSSTILGVTGMSKCYSMLHANYVPATQFSKIIGSGRYRPVGKLQSKIYDEANNNLKDHYKSHRKKISGNLHGLVGNVSVKPITDEERANVACGGPAFASIDLMAQDCDTKNPSKITTWIGEIRGNSSEGTWRLVVRTPSGDEVWQDMRTMYLWSAYLGDTNWCRASGSNNSSNGNPFWENDPSNYCNNSTYQIQDAAPESWCVEHSLLSTPSDKDSKKGNLKLNSAPISVKWLLPTTSDYQIASVNGLHLVAKDMAQLFWTASIKPTTLSQAWLYDGRTATVDDFQNRNTNYPVRCIGIIP